jgi:hypothetical protein
MIPPFDSNSVLPPHLGDPRDPADVSPFPCSIVELIDRFATTNERVAILSGFLQLRLHLRQNGVLDAFQWIDGSFLEDVENTQSRDPHDIDVVTFYWSPDPDFTTNLLRRMPLLADRDGMKNTYRTDHFPVDADYSPEVTIEATNYWCGLFSHTRSRIWKGMLRIDLNTPTDDTTAEQLLRTRP